MAKYTFIYDSNNDDFNVCHDVESPKDKHVTFNFELSDDTRWDNVMLEFAKFLDAVGYVGAHEKVDQYVSDEWEYIIKAHENTSNT